MFTLEVAGAAMMQQQEGNRMLAAALLTGLRDLGRSLGLGAPAEDALSGASFIQQEPDLAKEAGATPSSFAL